MWCPISAPSCQPSWLRIIISSCACIVCYLPVHYVWFWGALAALYLHVGLTDSWFIIQSDRRGNARASGQINSNFLTQVRWRLCQIRHPPTCLSTTSKFRIRLLRIFKQVRREIPDTSQTEQRGDIQDTDRTDMIYILTWFSRTLV